MDTMIQSLLTSHDLAAWLCATARRVERMARDGQIPCLIMPDSTIRFEPIEIRRWIKSRRREAAQRSGRR
jgi:hypothetical protein